ncbi:hypothetical protein HYV88_02175 [Candidatus Woesearchaeota archaeon]|nr:hypothetical protein [Candidatus Woesearchaeota archaeon]
MKKGDIWIATVIYIAIGVITLTLIVTAGVPLINDMRDRNTFVQSKEVMHSIDEAINTVVSDGPGSRRALNPVIIKKGELTILTGDKNQIYWQMQTKAKIQEISPTNLPTDGKAIIIREKNLDIIEHSDKLLVDYFIIKISSDYSDRHIRLISEGESSKLTGKFGLIISNEGIGESDTGGVGQLPVNIKIKVI